MAKAIKTRQECIAQIFAVADSWGMTRPTITERTSDESLLKLCKKLDRQGQLMGSNG